MKAYTTKEVSQLLGISIVSVRILLKEGKLRGFRPYKRDWRITETALQEYIEAAEDRENDRRLGIAK